MIERQQDRGTFVAAHSNARALFCFFRVVDQAGHKQAPTSHALECDIAAASAEDAARHHVRRGRSIGAAACMVERILLPAARFPDFTLPGLRAIHEELYVLYQRDYGVTIARAQESLTAIAAAASDALLLGLMPGAPLLEIARTAFDLHGQAVEHRVTRLDTRAHRYVAALE